MTKKSDAPAIRFKGFSDAWEQRKLGDVVKEITRNDPESEAPIMMITANNGFIEQSERYAFNNAGESLKKYILLKKGELAYNHGASKLRPYGSCFALTTAENARIPFVYHCFSAENQNAEFMSIELNGAEIENQLRKIVSSGARMDGLLNISFDEYTSVSVLLPGTEEQDRIADFFRHLDNLITLHQRKCISFTGRAGRLISTVNKKRITSSWEQRKVSDLAEKTYGGGTPTTSNEAYWNGDIPWIQSSDVVDGKLLGVEPRKWITQDGLNNSAAQRIPGNSIAIITRVGVGKLAFMPYSYATSQDFLSLSKLNAEPLFTVYACYKKLQSELNAVQGTSIKGITKDELLAKNIMGPRYAEQQQIGAFFKQLDNLITLHQRKCALLFSSFQALISMMFTTSTFSWEQRKVQDVADRFDNLRIPVAANLRVHGTTPYYGANGIQDYVEGFTHDGEFVLVAEDGANDLKNYPVKCVNGRIWVNNHAHVLQGKAGIADNSFLAFAISQSDIESLLVGGGRAKLNAETLMSIEFRLPCLQEQYRIGEYLTQLDHLITLHQRKFEKLTNVKKSMLEKMFPQNGSSYPEIRFKGFTDPWEQRKLGEVIRLNGRIGFRGYTEKDIVSKDDGGVLTFSPTNIVDNKLTTNCKNTYITRFKYDESPEIKIHNGDILFVKTGSTLGKSALVTGLSEDATLNPQVVVMRTNNLNAEFLAAMLVTNAIISQVNSAKIGGAVPTLTETRIKDFDVAIPVSEAEKEQIGQFFSQLDHLITLHQRELEKLQNIKKSMLEKMFV